MTLLTKNGEDDIADVLIHQQWIKFECGYTLFLRLQMRRHKQCQNV